MVHVYLISPHVSVWQSAHVSSIETFYRRHLPQSFWRVMKLWRPSTKIIGHHDPFHNHWGVMKTSSWLWEAMKTSLWHWWLWSSCCGSEESWRSRNDLEETRRPYHDYDELWTPYRVFKELWRPRCDIEDCQILVVSLRSYEELLVIKTLMPAEYLNVNIRISEDLAMTLRYNKNKALMLPRVGSTSPRSFHS